MIIDMHVHEKNGSSDSHLDILDAIKEAEAKGLDGLCFTDHDSLYLRDKIQLYQKRTHIKLFVGVEIFSLDGDLLCYGINSLPKKRLSAQETINFVKEQGGAVLAAHPYRDNNRGIGDLIYKLEGLDGIEAFNGRTKDPNNQHCHDQCKQYKLPQSGGSDAHTSEEIGNYSTAFRVPITCEKTLVSAIKNGLFYPVSQDDINKQRTFRII